MFIDEVTVELHAGDGGDGCCAFRREKFMPMGGPFGGNGGRGSNIIFKVDLGLLLTGEESRMSIFDITRANKGVSVDRRKEYTHENLCSNFIHKKAETFLVVVDPKKNPVPSLNSHPGQEFNYVLEGSLKIYIHNNEIVLNEGDSIFFDSTHRHAMIALNDKPAKFLAVII